MLSRYFGNKRVGVHVLSGCDVHLVGGCFGEMREHARRSDWKNAKSAKVVVFNEEDRKHVFDDSVLIGAQGVHHGVQEAQAGEEESGPGEGRTEEKGCSERRTQKSTLMLHCSDVIAPRGPSRAP